MSKYALSLLMELGLLRNQKPVDLKFINDEELSRLLSEYYVERIKNADNDVRDISGQDDLSSLISSFSAKNILETILASALIHSHLIVNDPLFEFCAPERNDAKVIREYYGFPLNSTQKRYSIQKSLSYFSAVAPLITAGILTVYPLDNIHRTEQIPIYGSEDRFRSLIPKIIYDFIHASAYIQPVVVNRNIGNFKVLKQEAKSPCWGISVSFANDIDIGFGGTYLLYDLNLKEENGETILALSSNPTEPLGREEFDAWVYQSINLTIFERFQSIARESSLAAELGHSYLTESMFEAELLRQSGFCGEDYTANSMNFLTVNDSLIQLPSAEAVVRLRERNEKLFRRFRSSLIDIGEKLSGVPEHEFRIKAERLFWSDIQPQVDEVQNAIRNMKVSALKGGIASLGGISLSIAAGSAIPLIGAFLYGALMEAIPSISDYMEKRKKPEYIWSRLTK